eukprot:23987-Eustigmatos_ZCMA.PRE.1
MDTCIYTPQKLPEARELNKMRVWQPGRDLAPRSDAGSESNPTREVPQIHNPVPCSSSDVCLDH